MEISLELPPRRGPELRIALCPLRIRRQSVGAADDEIVVLLRRQELQEQPGLLLVFRAFVDRGVARGGDQVLVLPFR